MDRPILVTGAAGGVVQMIKPFLVDHFTQIKMTDRHGGGGIVPCDLTDIEGLRRIMKGAFAILHFGGQSVEADWPVVRNSNIEGAFCLYEAARLEGVERIVFASSNHACGYLPAEQPFGPGDVFRPDSLYGVSKVFGESLAMLYADKHGIRSLAIRIGTVLYEPYDRRTLSTWIHPQDLMQLVRIGLEHPDIHAEIVYGVSEPLFPSFDNSRAFKLGYCPRHRAADYEERFPGREPPYPYIGGGFADLGRGANAERTHIKSHEAAKRVRGQGEATNSAN